MRRPVVVLLLVAAPVVVAVVPAGLSEDPVPTGQTAAVVADQAGVPPQVAPPPAPTTVPAAKPATTRQSRSTHGETADERAARVSRDAMIPHPRPPAERVIASDVQKAYDSAYHAPPIDLGVLTPTPTTKHSY